MSIFPSTSSAAAETSGRLPLMRELARDPVTGHTVWKNGNPVIVTGAEAVTSWAIAALRSWRGTSMAHTKRYGSEIYRMIGAAFTEDIKTAILPRLLKDALLQCPYITEVAIASVAFADDRLTCEIRINSIYGEVKIYVNDDEKL